MHEENTIFFADLSAAHWSSNSSNQSASATVAAANDVAVDVDIADAVNVVVHHLSCRIACFSIDSCTHSVLFRNDFDVVVPVPRHDLYDSDII